MARTGGREASPPPPSAPPLLPPSSEERVAQLIHSDSDILRVRSTDDCREAELLVERDDDSTLSRSSASDTAGGKGGGKVIRVSAAGAGALAASVSSSTSAPAAGAPAPIGSYPSFTAGVSIDSSMPKAGSSNPHHPNYNRRLSGAHLEIMAPLALAREHINALQAQGGGGSEGANMHITPANIAPAEVPSRTATPVLDAAEAGGSAMAAADAGTMTVQPVVSTRLPTHDQWEAPVALTTLPLLPCVIIR